MGPVRLYEVFNTMKLHWNTPGYDFVKYKGRSKGFNAESLEKSNDKHVYYQVAKRYKVEKDFVLTLLPLFLEDNNTHISMLLGKERCEKIAMEWYRKIQTMQKWFYEDCEVICKYIKDNGMTFQQFFLGNPILDFLIYDKIAIESFIILNKFIHFLDKNKMNQIIYTQIYHIKVQKYASFINVDLLVYQGIFEKVIKK